MSPAKAVAVKRRRSFQKSVRTLLASRPKTNSAVLACLLLLLTNRHGLAALVRRLLAWAFGLPAPKPGGIGRLSIDFKSKRNGDLMSGFVYYRKQGSCPKGISSPTMVIRTPYWKLYADTIAYAVATQGFNVVVQDCRGRFGSAGDFSFGAMEDFDGAELVKWLAKQNFPWFDSKKIVMWGISYLGITQWATLAGLERSRLLKLAKRKALEGEGGEQLGGGPPMEEQDVEAAIEVKAVAPLFSASSVHDVFFVNNAFKLDFYLRYLQLMTRPTTLAAQVLLFVELFRFERALGRNLVPSLGMQKLHKGLGLPYLFKYNPRAESRFWKNRDYSDARPVSPPAYIGTGWHDLFLTSSLKDYQALVQLHGRNHSRLTIGPWHHLESITSSWAFTCMLQRSLEFLKEQVGLNPPKDEDFPVQLWIMGKRASQGRWESFSSWPPEGTTEVPFLLRRGALQAPDALEEVSFMDGQSSPDYSCFRYDPLNPTPSLGGSVFNPMQAGEKLQTPLDSRADIVRFDTLPLPTSVTILGNVRLRLALRVSRPFFDVFARLIDVHPDGKSYNVCDAVLRHKAPPTRSQSHGHFAGGTGLTQEKEEAVEVSTELTFAATGKEFAAGHRIRLLVMGGAYPQYARHFGDAEQVLEPEPLEVHPCEVEVLHSEQIPSALWLPVLSGSKNRKRTLSAAAAARVRKLSTKLEQSLRKVQSEALCGA